MSKRASFLWGAFGSLLPEVLRFYKLVTAGNPIPGQDWVLYVIVSVVFLLCAGGFTVAWKPESELKAIWVGASWPVLVTTLYQAPPGLPKL